MWNLIYFATINIILVKEAKVWIVLPGVPCERFHALRALALPIYAPHSCALGLWNLKLDHVTAI